MVILNRRELAAMVDHTLLKAGATSADITRLCREAREHLFFAVCVNPFYVPLAQELLAGSEVKVCAVVGFPLGATAADVKAFEAAGAVRAGAAEVDMVLNIGALKEARYDVVVKDIRAVVQAAAAANPDALVKVIIETCCLTDEEKRAACRMAREAGARFVKTSTGFGDGGATVEDISLMRTVVGQEMGVKASGGIKTAGQTLDMIRAGASRIGTSSGVAIVNAMPD
ncbi:MAG TPA: deoxyribose-phosphate aldolase [Desulfotomaculum sp.]|nr:MAG: deoxyribose-phosphate aldolase [Peptococcaceae bacterium BRH_c8a]KJS75538.1 MAG: deoxyribose-phosphate aldolase [Desulfotomaculum sp. BICA1-6]HBX23277.1 deoxyribose-phosphate aldolase [Desulfotomaculum sp.]